MKEKKKPQESQLGTSRQEARCIGDLSDKVDAALAECDIDLDDLGMVGFLPGCDPGDHGGEGGGGGDGEIEIEITTDDFEDTDGMLAGDQRFPTPFRVHTKRSTMGHLYFPPPP